MNTKLKKIAKTAAVGIFFMALLMNVKVSLTDPFLTISNEVVAQTNSSSGMEIYYVQFDYCSNYIPNCNKRVLKCR
ncbi:hypothetical protein C8N25_1336 [Algoriphagus antarcticus]|uniref:Uncharacterized protein n=1 Tax=Algoriphagus antarcticus TaxID=238540 RepID=A0A3E0D7K1_9BACT|nr:hypothetical protein C8N25_1336 [Algoriphagus antarcticus]